VRLGSRADDDRVRIEAAPVEAALEIGAIEVLAAIRGTADSAT